MDIVCIAQGSIGTIENGVAARGFFTDKVENCRVYVFGCTGGTAFMHDSGQLRMKEIKEYLTSHGDMFNISYAHGLQDNQGHIHKVRLDEIASHFNCTDITTVKILRPTFSVSYMPETGLTDYTNKLTSADTMLRDPNQAAREAVNILNNFFIEPNSRDVPLDVQYRQGTFTPVPLPRLSIVEMLNNLKNDENHGLLGAVALNHYGNILGLNLPNNLKNFVNVNNLDPALTSLSHPMHKDGRLKKKLFGEFRQLPIFK